MDAFTEKESSPTNKLGTGSLTWRNMKENGMLATSTGTESLNIDQVL